MYTPCLEVYRCQVPPVKGELDGAGPGTRKMWVFTREAGDGEGSVLPTLLEKAGDNGLERVG